MKRRSNNSPNMFVSFIIIFDTGNLFLSSYTILINKLKLFIIMLY